MRFDVFQQRPPIFTKHAGPNISGHGTTVYEVDIARVGSVDASTGSEAIEIARRLPIFVAGRNLGRYPLVQPQREA